MRILITGKGSYIGSHIKAYFQNAGIEADEADTLGDEWMKADFSLYDTVVHVAAVVHQNAKNASENLFCKVNTELPLAIAEAAKSRGVSQFIFISTMGVYGKGKTLNAVDSIINRETPTAAVGGYGGSKLQAERLIKEIESDSFRVAIIRPPNVYGPGCRGNYIPLFRKLAMLTFFCPYAYTEIRQSMLYIDNLSELVRLIVVERSSGVYLPQDDVAPCAVEMIRLIRDICGKKTRESKLLGGLVKLFHRLPLINKIYGGIQYDPAVSDCFDYRYRTVGFTRGMERTLLGQTEE